MGQGSGPAHRLTSAAALRIDAKFAAAHFGLGVVANESGDLTTAAAHLRDAVDCDARNARIWHVHADVHRRLELFDEAVEGYRHSLDLDPTQASVWADAGACLDKAGRSGEAHVHMREALRLNPRDGRAWWNRAALEARVGLLDEAADSYRQLLDTTMPGNEDFARYASEWLETHERTEVVDT